MLTSDIINMDNTLIVNLIIKKKKKKNIVLAPYLSNLLKQKYKYQLSLSFSNYLQPYAFEVINLPVF